MSDLADLADTDQMPSLGRDTDATAFTVILQSFLESVVGVMGAALVDGQGETVDYAGAGDPFDLRVAAAHLQILVQGISRFGALGEPTWLVIRGSQKSFAATSLPDGYALILVLRPRAAFAISMRALSVCLRALAVEAGWDAPLRPKRTWSPVSVTVDHRGRPVRIGDDIAVEVLGALMGLSVRERGFRVRTAAGSELMLVREPRNRWYSDEAV